MIVVDKDVRLSDRLQAANVNNFGEAVQGTMRCADDGSDS